MRRIKNSIYIYLAIFIFGGGLFCYTYSQEKIIINQVMIPTATITDSELIKFFLEAYMIPETDVDKMVFIDATANGFGAEDLIKCYPSEQTYYFFPSDSAQKIMNSWKFTSNFQVVTQDKPAEVFESLESEKAANWILAGLLRRLNWNYQDLPIKIYFERDSTAVIRFDMWGYNEAALQWRPPPPPPKVPETTYDVMHIIRSDTLYVADTTYYDQYYIYRSISDTIFISEKDRDFIKKLSNPNYFPGLISIDKKK